MSERFAIIGALKKSVSAARTAAALTRHGAQICIIAPPDSYTALTQYKVADMLMPYAQIHAKLPAILRVLADEFQAQCVFAGDDGVFGSLLQLIQNAEALKLSESARALLARSMPPLDKAAELWSDSAFIIARAGDSSCPPPASLANPSDDAALAFAQTHGFPMMVKRDGSAGGNGVTRCENEAELRAALAQARGGSFLLQAFMPGQVYGVAVSGTCGRFAGGISFIKHISAGSHGVATVLKYDRREDLLAHAAWLYEHYRLNGYAGIDYIVDEAGDPHLLEINRSIVPKSHFSDHFGLDLTQGMLALLRDQPPPTPAPPRRAFVALFPLELTRDPASPYLAPEYHDVLTNDPAVLAAVMRDAEAHLSGRS